jgi:hypothetical protein
VGNRCGDVSRAVCNRIESNQVKAKVDSDWIFSAFSLAVMIVFFLALYKNVTGSSISATGIPGAGTTPAAQPQSIFGQIFSLGKSLAGKAFGFVNPF